MTQTGNNTNLAVTWIVMRDGRLQHGPFNDFQAARAGASRIGDVIIGRNRDGEILTYEVMWSANQTHSPRNPFHMAQRYRALAAQHSNQMWSLELQEAALLIEVLANETLGRIAGAKRDIVERKLPDPQIGLPIPAPEEPVPDTPPPPQSRRRTSTSTDAPVPPVTRTRRTTAAAPEQPPQEQPLQEQGLIDWPLVASRPSAPPRARRPIA